MIRLIKNYYSDPDPARNAELEEVRRRDEGSPFIGQIVNIDGRPTFADMFRRLNEVTGPDDVNVIANADCYFLGDEARENGECIFNGTLAEIQDGGVDEAYAPLRWMDAEGRPKPHEMGADEAYALLRWEDVEGGPKLYCLDDGRVHDDSQDAWCFRGPIRQKLIDMANFTPGRAGCDNALAARMATAGYRVSNPALDIRCIHLHRIDVRRYSKRREDAVPKPYLLIAPGHLGDEPKVRWIR
jgi:hypothetical protein